MNRIKLFFLFLTKIVLINATKEAKEFNVNFHQNDYKHTYERMELVRYSKDYVKEMSVVTFKYNRTQPATNITFTPKVDIGYDMVWVMQGYMFMSNEYRLYPIHFGAHFCKLLDANFGGLQRTLTCGNFTGCPFVKDRKIHMCKYYPDGSQFPPYIPNGSYKMQFQAWYLAEEIFVLDAYGTVSRPIPWY